MSNQSHYEINVSLNGRHLFATAPRSIFSPHDLKDVLPTIQEKFPESEGFSVGVTYWEIRGYQVPWNFPTNPEGKS